MTLLYLTLYLTHVSCAALSITGFALRGYWMATGNALLQRRAAHVLPHIVDTLLLLSALGMLLQWRLSPFAVPWLTAKLLALVLYIGLGMVALRFGRSRRVRVAAWLLALVTAGYIVSVALSRNPWGFLWGIAGS